jgi:hypothetical protein
MTSVVAAAAAELGRSPSQSEAMQQVWRVYLVSAFVACLVAAVTAFLTVRLAAPSPAQTSNVDAGGKVSGPNPKDTAPGKGAAPRPDLEVFEQTGTFFMIEGEAGAVGFPLPYAEPPAVEISGNERTSALITEITRSGFKWKCVGKTVLMRPELKWTAKGVKATKRQEDQR